ncbi:pentapeptide repeat-containing protein [Amycolatopsis sp. NPDC049252]|uniref:pentapeptide repeat-containing protein n=1 Tax=Amycolatopsis sp. NPDC049252 TaxID=3363933 RepID=UPI003714DE5A
MDRRRLSALLAAAAVAALLAAVLLRDGFSWSAVMAWLGAWWLVLVAGVLAVAAAVIGLRGRAPHPAPDDRGGRWTHIAGLITAFTALGALIFTALSLGATRDQIGIAEQGQITDRYTKAVDQLGSPGADHLQIRMGGIFALERLAVDSPRDQQTIVEVLAAFIRTSSPRADLAQPCPKTPADVEAAFLVLTRRDVSREGGKAFAADLQQTCLTGIRAPYADLTRLLLMRADLSGANLAGVHGNLANLDDARLAHADLAGAELSGLFFYDRADLSGANLREARLLGTIDHVKLTDTDLSAADLSGTTLVGVDLTGARHDAATNVERATHDASTIAAWW